MGIDSSTDIASGRAHIFRVSKNLSDLFPLSLPKTIAFIPSGAKTQKKEIIPYPRCGFGACLRCGQASFKHSDYRADGIWYCFFFRLFSFTNKNYLFSFLAAIIVSTTALTTASNPSSSTVSSSGTLNAAVTIDIL